MSPADPGLSVAVFGAGAFGRNHLRVYRELEGYVWRRWPIPTRRRPRCCAARRHPVFSSPEACLEACRAGKLHLDAVSICVPTSAHYSVASQALAQGLDVLLEKPIAVDPGRGRCLGRASSSRPDGSCRSAIWSASTPRSPRLEPLVNGPMFFEAHRLSVFHRRALDVDVVLDLMIHDLDIVLSFVRSPVRELHAVGLRILSPKVDIANVRLEFASGCVANFTASRVSTETVRKLRFFQPHQYLSIDYARQDLLIINVAPGENGEPSTWPPASRRCRAENPCCWRSEAFLESVRTRKPPRVRPEEARDALALALEINQAIQAHAARAGLV